MTVEGAGTINGIDLVLDHVIREERIDKDFWARKVLERSSAGAYLTEAGVVADLNHPYFSPAYAAKGPWQPYAALKEVGIGLYFL